MITQILVEYPPPLRRSLLNCEGTLGFSSAVGSPGPSGRASSSDRVCLVDHEILYRTQTFSSLYVDLHGVQDDEDDREAPEGKGPGPASS